MLADCDSVVVGLHVDPSIERTSKEAPFLSVYERYEQVRSIIGDNEIIPYETEQELGDLLAVRSEITHRYLDEMYRGQRFTGDHLPVEIIYMPRRHRFSSSLMRRRRLDNDI